MDFPELDETRVVSHLEIRVRFCETDLMGIVHHANYFVYMEAGRVDWLRKRGVTHAEWTKQGRHMPVIDAEAHYRAPAQFDDVLDVETRLAELRAVSLRFATRITCGGKLLVEGSTRLACVDTAHRLVRFGETMSAVLRAGEIPSP